MTYFSNVLSENQLKSVYRMLVMRNHPDKGGNLRIMQKINEEYNQLKRGFYKSPLNLQQVALGNIVYVNQSKCIVTHVSGEFFRAKSTRTQREATFSKKTGMCITTPKFKARVYNWS